MMARLTGLLLYANKSCGVWFTFGDDKMTRHVLQEFSCIYTRVQPATANVFAVVANTRTKSIQKEIVQYNIKGKYPEPSTELNRR